MRIPILAAMMATVAAGQNVQRAIHLTNPAGAQANQELLTVLRTVADVTDVSMDAPTQTLTVAGTAGKVAISEWIVQLLDQPSNLDAAKKQIRDSATWQYTAPGATDDVVRVFYLKNVSSPQGMQELLTNLRTVGDVQRVFSYTTLGALAMRGPAAQMALSAWMIEQLDQPGQPSVNPAAFQYTSPQKKEELVRVFYLPRITASKQLSEVLTAVRTKVRVEKAFYYSKPAALVLRGSPDQMAASERLILQSDVALR